MNPSSILLVATLSLMVSAWSDGGLHSNEAAIPMSDFETLTIKRSGCLFDCPAFDVSIRSDGLVRHSGPHFDNTGGPIESRADQNGLAQIAMALRVARIDEMRDSYQSKADGCVNLFSDMPTIYLWVSREQGNRNKSVFFNAGCVGPAVPAERLDALIKTVDQVAGSGVLLEQRKRARPLDGTSG
ncbi:hypothetical protein MasN3_47990 [Massilia varians]|jgi:hypothetical protein|uniref:DUF6438 domain-containing protein n=2 Tax=Massilia varians TaxID=457921 RepID=A0ABN6TJU9_9BURK|nr:hypothetical protein MasN3_47990 [Massilia varians]